MSCPGVHQGLKVQYIATFNSLLLFSRWPTIFRPRWDALSSLWLGCSYILDGHHTILVFFLIFPDYYKSFFFFSHLINTILHFVLLARIQCCLPAFFNINLGFNLFLLGHSLTQKISALINLTLKYPFT